MSCLLRPAIAFALLGLSAAAQPAPAGPAFEVASIRPGAAADAELIPIRLKAERSRIHYVNASLRDCIRVAYGVKDFQIVGPAWLGNRFNIEARYPSGVAEDQVPAMLQALLHDRFKLQLHPATKDHAVYALVAEKSGPKLKPTEFNPSELPDSPTRRPGTPVFGDLLILGSPSGMRLKGPAISLGGLAETLTVFTDRPVVDRTGLTGRYDLDLVFLPDGRLRMHGGGAGEQDRGIETQADPPPTLFDALRIYGLKLESTKAPLQVLVVDHLEKEPSEN